MTAGNGESKIYLYWGKARQQTGGAHPLHLLAYHSLDVAAVASVWWEASPPIRRAFAEATKLPEDEAKAWALFFIALHDLGKFDLRFQLKAPAAFRLLQGEVSHGQNRKSRDDYDHGKGGLQWFEKDRNVGKEALDLMQFIMTRTDDKSDHALAWIRAVTGHHGFVRWHVLKGICDDISDASRA
ncbi:MAG: CRISPR-associated endonuclease Cas3'', partial [Zoogloeaceae bacterium]|nr:CRISPR-associated endonuclease Cas3'' [Zoogloeaceae bacterium]